MKTRKTKLQVVASKENSRFAINGIYLDTEEKRLVATNGKCMAIIPAEIEEGDTTAILNAELWTEKRKKNEPIEAKVNGSAVMPNGKTFQHLDGQFPSYKDVIPTFEGKKTVKFSLDPSLLMDLAHAMGFNRTDEYGQGITLEMEVNEDGENTGSPILITNKIDFEFTKEKAKGLLMPIQY